MTGPCNFTIMGPLRRVGLVPDEERFKLNSRVSGVESNDLAKFQGKNRGPKR
jgi:hypothetical protein